jgi:hypothetical protein
LALEFGVEAFNLLNHPQLGVPAANISSASTSPTGFGHITSTVNTSPVGSGTPREVQFLTRFTF